MIYAISQALQPDEVKKYCHPCMRLLIAGVDLEGYGPFAVCGQSGCPHEVGKTPVIGKTDTGEEVLIRKLGEKS